MRSRQTTSLPAECGERAMVRGHSAARRIKDEYPFLAAGAAGGAVKEGPAARGVRGILGRLASIRRPRASSLREHLSQGAKYFGQRLTRQGAEPLYQPFSIHRAQLIENDITGPLLKPTPDSPGICPAAGRQRRDDNGAEVGVQFIR